MCTKEEACVSTQRMHKFLIKSVRSSWLAYRQVEFYLLGLPNFPTSPIDLPQKKTIIGPSSHIVCFCLSVHWPVSSSKLLCCSILRKGMVESIILLARIFISFRTSRSAIISICLFTVVVAMLHTGISKNRTTVLQVSMSQ